MDYMSLASPIVSALIAIAGAYVAMRNATNQKFEDLRVQIAELSTKIDGLTTQVEKHNNVIERTYVLEGDMRTAFKRIDELKARDEKLEDKIERI